MRSLALASALLCQMLHAQVSQPQAELLPGANGTWNVEWWGIEGRSYFLQASDDLVNWRYAPVIEAGNDEIIGYETGSLGSRHFLRLAYTDQTASDLDTADFDDDGLGNLAEISAYHTDPLRSDSDNDGLPDDWEIRYGIDPNDDGSVNPVNGGNGDLDGDGFTNLSEYTGGTDPKEATTFPNVLLYVTNKARATSSGPSGGPYTGNSSRYLWKEGWSPATPLAGIVTPTLVNSTLKSIAFPATVEEALQENSEEVYRTLQAGPSTVEGTSTFHHEIGVGYSSTWGSDQAVRCWLKAIPRNFQQNFKMAKLTWRKDPFTGEDQVINMEGVTFSVPANSEYSAFQDLDIVGESVAGATVLKRCNLVPVDGVVRYPTGETLKEYQEHYDDGALIALKRLDPAGKNVAPQTAIEVGPVVGSLPGWRIRFKFDSGGRYIIYKKFDEIEPVVSEVTEFDATVKNRVVLIGQNISSSRGVETITVQLGVGEQWVDVDVITATVVQSEFVVDLRVFIPYAWVDIPLHPLYGDVVAEGDNRGFDPTLLGTFRLAHREVINPYPQFVKNAEDRLVDPVYRAAGMTKHYRNSDVVNYDSSVNHSGLVSGAPSVIAPGATPVATGYADVSDIAAEILTSASSDVVTFANFSGSGSEPLIYPAASIDWDIDVAINISDPLNPLFVVDGEHDDFPAYELYINANHPIFPVTEAFSSLPDPADGVLELMTNFGINILHSPG